jgi:hypothetical protein
MDKEHIFWSGQVDQHERCIRLVEQFANEYVEKWATIQGDSAKAAGWAILQAAAMLKERAPK